MNSKWQQVWRPLGCIYTGAELDNVRLSHGAYPTPVITSSDTLRILFATRDAESRSHISSIDMARDLQNVSASLISERPLLSPGPCGHFDDSGVTPGSLVTIDQQEYLLYMGWNLGVTAPFRNSIGLARYDSLSNEIERVSDGPFLSRSHEDPVNLSYPFIMREQDEYLLWYGSDMLTRRDKEGMLHVLKLARSRDFKNWSCKKTPEIALAPGELTISRPTLLKIKNQFHMWYCYRKPGCEYQIGYAHSDDLTQWTRRDEVVRFAEGAGEWDAESRCYPYVFELDGRIIMLYSGNRFGRDGFGAAELVGDIQSLESMEM